MLLPIVWLILAFFSLTINRAVHLSMARPSRSPSSEPTSLTKHSGIPVLELPAPALPCVIPVSSLKQPEIISSNSVVSRAKPLMPKSSKAQPTDTVDGPMTPPKSGKMQPRNEALARRRRSSTSHCTEEEREQRKRARKSAHSDIERRRRIKINEQFDALKELVPACNQFTSASGGDVGLHKLVILQETVQFIRYLKTRLDLSDHPKDHPDMSKQAPSILSAPPVIQSPFIISNSTSNGKFHKGDGRSASISSQPSNNSSPTLSANPTPSSSTLAFSSAALSPLNATSLTLPPPALPALPALQTLMAGTSSDSVEDDDPSIHPSHIPSDQPPESGNKLKISSLLC